MFDVAPTEFLAVAIVALVVIGPKDLPKAMRVLGYWVGKARGVARQFRSGFDTMVREAELAEMEKKWAAENERIMQEHAAGEGPDVPAVDGSETIAASSERATDEPDLFSQPVTVEQPAVRPADTRPAVDAKANS